MKIAVVGAGAVGGFFGGKLAQGGSSVSFLARGATLEALRSSGLKVSSIDGDFALPEIGASDKAEEIGTVDAVLFGVKAWQVKEAAQAALPLFGPETCGLPLLNGIEAPERIAAVVGEQRTLGGLCRVVAKQVAPAHIEHFGAQPSVDFGELDDTKSSRVQALQQAFTAAGVEARLPESIAAAMWEKFVFIAPVGAVGAITGATLGEIRQERETRELLETAMREVLAIAQKLGIPARPDTVERAMHFVDKLPPETTASMQRDLLAGRPSEFDAQCGAVLRKADLAGVDVPVNRFLHAALVLAAKA